MSPGVSVVIPVYNTGALLAKTVGYIRKQTYKDFELLLIDDGSNNETRELCERLSESDPRIRVIHKKMGASVLHVIWEFRRQGESISHFRIMTIKCWKLALKRRLRLPGITMRTW